MGSVKRRNALITCFVIIWPLVFQYETLRHNYLSPLAHRELPKLPLLFPPAGWVMFFNVDRSYGFAEVYGIKGSSPTLLDPHDIFRTKAVGYDNIHRNVLVTVLDSYDAPAFCRFLRRRFPSYEEFAVLAAQYPDIVTEPNRILRGLAYRCQ